KRIHVLLDLVPGHTSEDHPWFLKSKKEERNEFSERYIWTDFWIHGAPGMPYIGGESERNGCYLLNFFKCQPALNYGFLHPSEPWQFSMNHAEPLRTREAMKDVMRFWLSHGCDGFRVDMANSLVKKDDENNSGSSMIWRDVRRMLDLEFPDAVMVSEWCAPKQALRAGFDMDFYLNSGGLNGYCTLMRDYYNDPKHDASYFKKDSGGNINRFLGQYLDWYEDTKDLGYISLLTCNHDTTRPRYSLDPSELKLAYAFIFTMPGVPFLYYGDEIGMRFLDVPTKEGGYTRTGSRTPMQWSREKNLGFSNAEADVLYLPVDPADDAPTVLEQSEDPDSLLNTVKRVLTLRHQEQDLQADALFSVVCSEVGKPFVYRRGDLLLAVNPNGDAVSLDMPCENREMIFRIGSGALKDGCLTAGPQSFLVFR
ncbi:MAG: hypothetical protein IKP86_08285, partial [Anaerolineaceae bacterium]|nr:hypothetical protein [Anaerolineaceae bacterium]